MNFAFSAEQEAFRAEVREFLSAYRELDGFFQQGHKWPAVKALFRAMGERGWLALSWPAELGGLGMGPVHEYILWHPGSPRGESEIPDERSNRAGWFGRSGSCRGPSHRIPAPTAAGPKSTRYTPRHP